MRDLTGEKIIVTGVIDGYSRNDIHDLILKNGGDIAKTLSSKVTMMVVGDKSGPAKLTKARGLSIPISSLEDFI